MNHVFVIGGTRFIGRHTVTEFLNHDYRVTLFNRDIHANPFAENDAVSHIEGDRTDEDTLRNAAQIADPDIVVDCIAYHPQSVAVATDSFEAVDAYVYISSGSAYAEPAIPQREDETTLAQCSDEQATNDSMETYGARKAEGDREVFAAAERGVNAMAIRPFLVYGPHDYTERTDYWIDRVVNGERVLVPGDGDSLLHRAYVGDVASAIRIIAESGTPGEAYNVGDRQLLTLESSLSWMAEALDTELEIVHASARELADFDLEPTDFPLYTPVPFVGSTDKLAALGWESTPITETIRRTVADHLDSDRTGREIGPDPGKIDRFIQSVA